MSQLIRRLPLNKFKNSLSAFLLASVDPRVSLHTTNGFEAIGFSLVTPLQRARSTARDKYLSELALESDS